MGSHVAPSSLIPTDLVNCANAPVSTSSAEGSSYEVSAAVAVASAAGSVQALATRDAFTTVSASSRVSSACSYDAAAS